MNRDSRLAWSIAEKSPTGLVFVGWKQGEERDSRAIREGEEGGLQPGSRYQDYKLGDQHKLWRPFPTYFHDSPSGLSIHTVGLPAPEARTGSPCTW